MEIIIIKNAYIYSIFLKLKFKRNLKSEKIEWWQQKREMEMDRWCWDIDYGACVPRYVHAHVYTLNAFRYLRQSDSYWYLEEEHRRTINLDDRRLRGLGFVRVGVGRGRLRSVCRMHLHLKWLCACQIFRCEIMWCVISIVSFLLFPFGSTMFRYFARQHRILGYHWDPGFFLVDRGFRFLFVTNIPLM